MKQQINEFKRMQLLAGVITESEYRKSLNETQHPEDVEDFLNDMIDMSIPEDAEEGEIVKGTWEAEEYADEDSYGEAADDFKNAYNYIKSKGGKITVEGNPDVTYTALKNGDIQYELKVTLDESSLNEAENGDMITQNDIDTLHGKGFDIITDKDWDFVRIQKMLFAPKADWRFLNNLLSSRNISANVDYYRGDGDKGRSKELEISKKYFDKNLKYPPLGSKLNEAENGNMITQNEIESLASSLDTELKFSPETLKGRFVDLGINFILSPDQNQLILNVTPSTGYDDPQEFIDDIESEIGFPDYDFSVKGSKVYITKK